ALYSIKAILVFDAATGRQVGAIPLNPLDREDRASPDAMAGGPGGRLIAVPSQKAVSLYRADGCAPVARLRYSDDGVEAPQIPRAVAFSPDGKRLAVLLARGGTSPRLLVWDLTTGALTTDAHLTTVRSVIQPLEWAADGSALFVSGAGMVDPTTAA